MYYVTPYIKLLEVKKNMYHLNKNIPQNTMPTTMKILRPSRKLLFLIMYSTRNLRHT